MTYDEFRCYFNVYRDDVDDQCVLTAYPRNYEDLSKPPCSVTIPYNVSIAEFDALLKEARKELMRRCGFSPDP